MSLERKEHVEIVEDEGYERRQQRTEVTPSTRSTVVSRIIQIIAFITTIIVLLIAVRFFLQLIGANEANAFANIVFGLTNPLVAPFASLFPPTAAQEGIVIEWSTLVAGVVYIGLGWLIATLIRIIFGSSGSVRRVRTVERSRL